MIEAMKKVAELCGDTSQGIFYRLKAAKAHPVKLTSVREIFTPQEIQEIMERIKPQKHECFATAQRLSMEYEYEYAEGELGIGGCFGAEHALNKKGDAYFDFTVEMVLRRNVEEEDFVCVAEFSDNFVRKACLELGVFSSLVSYKFSKDRTLDYE